MTVSRIAILNVLDQAAACGTLDRATFVEARILADRLEGQVQPAQILDRSQGISYKAFRAVQAAWKAARDQAPQVQTPPTAWAIFQEGTKALFRGERL
jgi:hypothetical protein